MELWDGEKTQTAPKQHLKHIKNQRAEAQAAKGKVERERKANGLYHKYDKMKAESRATNKR